jgi:acyl-CoA synthetase (AMP-forming)/AMP-acid ligase II
LYRSVERPLRSPQVLEAATVGVPDKIFGEQVKAVLVLKPGESSTEEKIRHFCFERMADYKVPNKLNSSMSFHGIPGARWSRSG